MRAWMLSAGIRRRRPTLRDTSCPDASIFQIVVRPTPSIRAVSWGLNAMRSDIGEVGGVRWLKVTAGLLRFARVAGLDFADIGFPHQVMIMRVPPSFLGRSIGAHGRE
jgi:hypothetical protein